MLAQAIGGSQCRRIGRNIRDMIDGLDNVALVVATAASGRTGVIRVGQWRNIRFLGGAMASARVRPEIDFLDALG